MTRNWNLVRAKLVNPSNPGWEAVEQQLQALIADQDAQGGHIYLPFRLPTHAPFLGPLRLWRDVTEEAAGSVQDSEQDDPTPVTTTAPLPSLPLNDASTPFAQRDYVDPTTSVTGKHGGQHTRIRADKWHEPQQLKKTNPRAYRKKTKRLRHKDNRDKRIKAAHQAAASDAAAADTANAQPAWAAEDAEGDEMQLDEEEEEDDLEEFDMDLDEDLDEPEPQMEQEQSGYVYGGKSGGSLRRVREASFREPSFASD